MKRNILDATLDYATALSNASISDAKDAARILPRYIRAAVMENHTEDDARAVVGELTAEVEGEDTECEWKHDIDDGAYVTDCGNMFHFEYVGPIENKMKFCPYCGKSLKADRYGEEG